ncbi:MAG: endolytic transglycosylase MltG, partial [Alphaproteobacteria bacterium]|nr:endolytic transglycosylase MltG [Alphaproteobacteria bacterium]
KKTVVLFFLAMTLAGFFLAYSYVVKAYHTFNEVGTFTEMIHFEVPQGVGLKRIAYLLEKSGAITDRHIFQLGVRLSKKAGQLKTGEYELPPYASPRMIMTILTEGQTIVRRITIPEGLTVFQIAELIDGAYGLTGSIETLPPEGSILPNTYHYTKGDTKQALLDRMSTAMNKTIQELWQKRQANLPVKTPQEAVILASIVEKETGLKGERAHVASVFVNRLRKGMRLQSDPTVIYALSNGTGILKRQLWSNDLKVKHTHNTYVIKGLPPTPIANPGRAALTAVLNPMDTNDLYFVADGTGGHVFAETFEEHNINVRRWRNIKKMKKADPRPPHIPLALDKDDEETDSESDTETETN